MESATFGAGCFWGVEDAFMQLGVETSVGYMGGELASPTYKQVCTGSTGHVEVCQVRFDPTKIAFEELLAVFWEVHDPTQVDRQGPDVGRQYRSVIFAHTPEQAQAAKESKSRQQAHHKRPIATQIEPSAVYWPAEEYHQKYFLKTGQSHCGI